MQALRARQAANKAALEAYKEAQAYHMQVEPAASFAPFCLNPKPCMPCITNDTNCVV